MKNNPLFIEKLEYFGTMFEVHIFDSGDFSTLENITQVYPLLVDADGKVLIVSSDSTTWVFPGGSVEKEESLIDTLNREAYEEAAVVVDQGSIIPLFYQLIFKHVGKEKVYDGAQVRFFGRISKKDKFISDPGGNTKYQKYVAVDDLQKFVDWKSIEVIKSMVKKTMVG